VFAQVLDFVSETHVARSGARHLEECFDFAHHAGEEGGVSVVVEFGNHAYRLTAHQHFTRRMALAPSGEKLPARRQRPPSVALGGV
jgi:hypothetical protein